MIQKLKFGPLINHNEVNRVEEWVNEAVTKGGKILTGGKRISDSCFEPTVIVNPSDDAIISQKRFLDQLFVYIHIKL